jgi:pimeloyl-[acyl-carrier protein] methyl ester esterase
MKLVLWNGWAMQPGAFAPLVRELPEAAVHTPALTASAGESLADWARRLSADVTPDAVLVGWSLGAMLALAAVAHGARPRALVLIGATARFVASDEWPHGLAPGVVDGFRRGFQIAPAKTMRRFLALQGLGDADQGTVLDTLANELIDPADASLAPGLAALCEADLTAICAKIATVPTLLIHGSGDALMPLDAAQWLADTLPDARLMTLPNRGHAPHVSDPATVAAAIRAFAGRPTTHAG